MKELINHTFNFAAYEKELSEFKDLLDKNPELREKEDILPFFKARPNLSSQIATIIPQMVTNEKLAYEFDIFGDFASDIAVGDINSNTFCFIEFEDAKTESIFGKNKIEYEGILIIGRDHFLDTSLKKRLDWRSRKTVVNSKHLYCYTFDELYSTLTNKIKMLKLLTA